MPSNTSEVTDPARAPETMVSPALPARYYTDPQVFDLEKRKIFGRSWQLVGHESDLPRSGARIVGRVADQEVLVVRTESGGLAAYLNVCRHRGSRLAVGPEPEGKAIRCPYHGWTYKLDGRLVGAPEGRRIPCLDKAGLGLHPARVESFLGLLFVNLDTDAVPLADRLPGLPERISRYMDRLEPIGSRRIHNMEGAERQPANWKIVVDNYLEGYHVPVAHPGLMRLLDYRRYTAEVHDSYVLFEAPLRGKPSSNRLERLYQQVVEPMPGLEKSDRRVWRYVTIYPNTMIDLYPDHVLAWSMVPTAVDQVAVPGAYYGRAGASWRTRVAQRLNIRIGNITNDEDILLVGRVQRGLAISGYEMGPLSEREIAVGWFADRVRADLGKL
ncbi:aromatic ring-hydroxylating dioxygenase subunit alpha [Streptosporangium sp. NPDC000396]|uniref:aromatic ring-hydroxylating oxygenase subunit alpha n=1 Tax=Streptosporangium sp. NPDC000396 TaxID=3366185 RepID=UPI00368AA1CA